MKVLVPVKRVVDANVKVRVKPDGTGIDLTNVKMAVNPFCEIAIEEAVRLVEAGVAEEVIAVSVGSKACQEQLRTCLALGADRAILVETQDEMQPLAVAKILQAIYDQEAPQIVIFGKQSIDGDNGQTGQMFAALTGLAQGTFASELAVADGQAQVVREVDGGPADRVPHAADRRHDRPAAERAALRLAAEHHESPQEAPGRDDAGDARRRRGSALRGAEGGGPSRTLRRRPGRVCRRARGKTED